mgnify:CR=1 FL=1
MKILPEEKKVAVVESELPEHLGGHMNRNWTDTGTLKYFMDELGVKSMVDIGCGIGDQTIAAHSMGLYAVGVDGDYTIKRPAEPRFITHDYSKAPLGGAYMEHLPECGFFDLGWSIEFLEHVDEKYIPNFMETFKLCKFVVVTHAYPGQGGHHHVNEQEKEYWIKIFKKYGFKHSQKILNKVLSSSTMLKRNRKDRFSQQKRKMNWLDMNGSVFINRNF